MGLMDRLKGVQRPDDGATPVDVTRLTEALLALNGPDAPWELRPDGNGDVVGDWRLADARWRELVGQAGFAAASRLTLRPHPTEQTVHACMQTFEANWNLGSGHATIGSRHERNGLLVRANVTVRVAGQEPYSFTFDSDELRDAARDTVTAAGWTWRPVRGTNGL